MQWVLLVAVAITVGCARAPGVQGPDGNVRSPLLPEASDLDDTADYDPWRPFNEAMFSFNHDVLDRWLLKPAATAWDTGCRDRRAARSARARQPRHAAPAGEQPAQVRRSARTRVGRFVVNSTVGVAGLFDVASSISSRRATPTRARRSPSGSARVRTVLPTMPPSPCGTPSAYCRRHARPLGYVLPFVANR
jgi:ABC-type transporter lipoprotein component MlaA